jgi:hypothetical protein
MTFVYWLITLFCFVLLLEMVATSDSEDNDNESFAEASQFLCIATSFLMIADPSQQSPED